ncbi:iron-sulfur cluster-binding protein, partial [Paenibacillus sp. HGF5]|uniref:iron-sulfur cluster-binding protein n=1 Tax=Paenibacillus sp. HGF5 TaxID=908341 RepID=UPI000207232E
AGVPFGINGFHEISRDVTVKSGGTIVDAVDPSRYDTIFACGPVGMMHSLAQKAEGTDAKLHVSIEKRMGCGIGACNSCTLTAAGSNRKACTDGPVFLAKEVNWNDLHRL